MTSIDLSKKAEKYLQRLCVEIPGRRVGSKGNRAATDFFAQVMASFGFQIECPEFDCIDWSEVGAHLVVNGDSFEAFVSPYSLGCDLSEPLIVVSTVNELEAAEITNKILLMRDEIAKEQLMPKNFPFYNPDHHRRIIRLLETKSPGAIIAATSRNPEMVGAQYPFPLFEDGDFDIPSVYLTAEEGDRLVGHAGREVSLAIHALRSPARGCNVVAHKRAASDRRIVVCAHIDSKDGSPGALDNAAGVVALLLLAEHLKEYEGRLGIEILAINGEDYYSSPGEVHYLQSNQDKLDEILLAINIDGAGYYQGKTAYSLYDCPDELAGAIRKAFSSQRDMVEGEQWYQSDHMIFVQNQIPALAITSERSMEILTQIAHTAKDRPELVDPARLVNAALALRELLQTL